MFGRRKDKAELTAKGKFFLRYCEKIADGTWTQHDYIEAYEDSLKYFIESCLHRTNKASDYGWEQLRVVGAKILVESLKNEVECNG